MKDPILAHEELATTWGLGITKHFGSAQMVGWLVANDIPEHLLVDGDKHRAFCVGLKDEESFGGQEGVLGGV